MVVKYVTTDAGRWGTGVGRPLTAAEFDENIYTVKLLAETAAAQTPVSIDDFSVDGANFYVNLTDGSTAGPYALPVSTITPRGEWLAATSYAVNDTIYVSGLASAYIVRYAHISGEFFNENATNGDGQFLYGKIVEAPTASLPSGGATGMILAKSSSDDYDLTWTYPTVLLPTGGATGQTLIKYGAGRNDASWADIPNDLPSGGATGYLLSKSSSTDYDTAWIAPPSTLPTGGATGYVLSKVSGTDYDVTWVSAALSTGPTGPAGAASTVTGPTGADGAAGASVTGATGPTGPASTVTGPTGPAGGPTGPTGASSTDDPYAGLLTVPVLTNFTSYGSTATTVQNTNNILIYRTTVTSGETRGGIYIAAPSTPYRVMALIRPFIWLNGAWRFGFSDGTKIQCITSYNAPNSVSETQWLVQNWTSTDVYSGNLINGRAPLGEKDIWVAAADDGTNAYLRYSFDGVTWHTLYSVAKSSGFLGSSGYSRIILDMDNIANISGQTAGLLLRSWSSTGSAP